MDSVELCGQGHLSMAIAAVVVNYLLLPSNSSCLVFILLPILPSNLSILYSHPSVLPFHPIIT